MSTSIKTLSALAETDALRGKRVFIRSDLNVPKTRVCVPRCLPFAWRWMPVLQ